MGAYSASMAEAGPYLVIGVQIAGAMLMFVVGGYFADRWLGTEPWLLILGCVLGMVAVMATLIRTVHELEARNRAKKRRGSPPAAPSKER